ncbi:MAG: hypothetical protein K2I38_07575 [Duncaniella sp.]|nr:hypothetical protein [Duncaniella sp.]
MASSEHCGKTMVVLNQYKSYGLPSVAEWYAANGGEVRLLYISEAPKPGFLSKKRLLCEWAKAFFKWAVQPLTFRNRVVYCISAQLPFMLICRLAGPALGNCRVYFHNFYLHELGRKPLVKRILKFLLADSRFTILTQSEGEIGYYRALSSKVNLKFIPFCSDFTPVASTHPKPTGLPDSYVFTGGYTNRDYPLMFRLAGRFPDRHFVFVASSLNAIECPPSLTNVTLMRDLPKDQFEAVLTGAEVVIVPLREDVGASGQMLAVSAARNAKPVVYTDLSVINYFFSDGAGIPYSLGDLDSLAAGLQALLSDPDLRERCGRKALERSRNFTMDAQLPLLRDVMGI